MLVYFGRLAVEEGGVGVRDAEPGGGTDTAPRPSPVSLFQLRPGSDPWLQRKKET